MRRIKDYCKFIAWQTGMSYLLLWAVTFWTLDEGAIVFGKSGVCHPNAAKALFYWVCDPSSPLSILATVANVALTLTVWAPVYVAAATSAQPDAVAFAGPIIAVHVIGFPLGLFVLVKMVATALDFGRKKAREQTGASVGIRNAAPDTALESPGGRAASTPPAAAIKPQPARPRKVPPPRHEFGLRRPADARGRSAAR